MLKKYTYFCYECGARFTEVEYLTVALKGCSECGSWDFRPYSVEAYQHWQEETS